MIGRPLKRVGSHCGTLRDIANFQRTNNADGKKRKQVIYFLEDYDEYEGEENQPVKKKGSRLFSKSEHEPVPVFSACERLEEREIEKEERSGGDENDADANDDDDDYDDYEEDEAAEDFLIELEECSDEVILPHRHALPHPLEFNAGFAEIVKGILEELKKNADSRALTRSWRHICLAMNIDCVTQVLVAAVPLSLQEFTLEQQWDVSKFLRLETVEREDGTLIVYGDFCQKHTSYNLEHECYTGYTGHPPRRMNDHRWGINAARSENGTKASLHYRHASSEGVKPNFRLLAVFPLGTDPIYGQLLEALFMILLNSFQDSHDTRSQYAPEESFQLVSSIREKLQLPIPPWKGLNRVWSLSQSLPSSSILTSCSPCLHCGMMTYPASHRTRASGEDIFAGFICCWCSKHAKNKGSLPTEADVLGKYQQQDLIGRRIAGLKIICDDCGMEEGESTQKFSLRKDDLRLLCLQCRKKPFKGKPRTGQDGTRLRKRNEITSETKCGNPHCNITQECLLLYTMAGVLWCEELEGYRCRQCWDLYRRWSAKGQPRERTLAECNKWRQNLEKKGPAARVECENCHKVKGEPGASLRFNKTETGHLCTACYAHLCKVKKARPIENRFYQDAMEKLKLDRKNGVKIVCGLCGREDGVLSRPHALSRTPPYVVHCFQGCLGSSKKENESTA